MSKNWQKLDIFSKKIAKIFFEKIVVFGNFLTVKWQFSGGSGSDLFVYKQFFTTEMLDYGPNNPRLTPSGQT